MTGYHLTFATKIEVECLMIENINSDKMASNMEGSIHRGCDFIFDFSCFTCQENDRNTEAEFYCEECSEFYCSKCMEYHNYFYKKHAILSKENMSLWPKTDVVEQGKCKEHRKEKLTIFCEDHSELICHVCHIHHQKCSHLVLISDKMKQLNQKGDFKQLSATIYAQHQQLIHEKDDLEENIKSLEKSYTTILEEIKTLRKTINDSLDQLEKNTKKELDTLLVTMRKSIQTDIEDCTKSITNITCHHEDFLKIKDKSEALSFIKYRKCIDQSLEVESALQEMATETEMRITFRPDTTIQQTLSTLSGLGQILRTVKQSHPAKRTTQNTDSRQNKPKETTQSDPGHQTTLGFKVNKSHPESSTSRSYSPENGTNDLTKSGQVSDPVSSSSHQLVQRHQPAAVKKSDKIMKVKSSKRYSVQIKDELYTCYINGICETASGELLLTDQNNNTVKLMDQTYKVVAQCVLPLQPWSMCSIDSSRVAVSYGWDKYRGSGRGNYHEVHFIRVINGQLIKGRILKLHRYCIGIAHQDGNLYITDGRALYLYTLDGSLVREMYKDTSSYNTVTSCAVSPDGDRIYVFNNSKQLVILSRDGTVISTLTDISLKSPSDVIPGLHVTDLGQVLVCGFSTDTIVQVDRDGRQRLAEVVTAIDGVARPTSVYYSKNTGSIIVGMMDGRTPDAE
ncbi:E3 ubiquitin/ISG15 ligase TRIM25-like isoform X2 [Dreissena polymorpha]|uniref:E3 ubiquitin/ISG15 ligase TRIM25-like isoform X2 n=1 Tax=Dreissena polymorpha TaxID=45954 RepID=UPI002264D17A|nr:E3 ubiquitin/ISG15 ligase TRIM25-like isoform X2 [Dreissena polymorpha]